MRTDGGLRNPGRALWLAALPVLLYALVWRTDAQAQVRPAPPPPLDSVTDAPEPSTPASPDASASPSGALNRPAGKGTPAPDTAVAPAASPVSSHAASATEVATPAAAATAAIPAPGADQAEDLEPALPSVMEIPPAVALPVPSPVPPHVALPVPPPVAKPPSAAEPQQREPGSAISAYENSQNPPLFPNVGSLREFIAEGEESSSIGVRLRETRRTLKTGEEAGGLLVVAVTSGSPAEKAGLRPFQRTSHPILMAMAIVSAAVFPPAVIMVPVVDFYERSTESYDMIIGVDGERVTNFFDFEERMRDVHPGEMVYLSVVRNGKRVQLTVSVPLSASAPSK